MALAEKNSLPPFARMMAPSVFDVEPREKEIFERQLRSFVPAEVFDAHVHLYDFAPMARAAKFSEEVTAQLGSSLAVDYTVYARQQQAWMGDRAPLEALCFAFPYPAIMDMPAANAFVRESINDRPGSRGLLMIRPGDDPSKIEEQVLREGWAGFKVYHIFSARPDTQNAEIGEFLPDWAWDIANRHGLAIMLHMVKQRSLADEGNQQYINTYCKRYPGAKLILAHAGRGFCARHTTEGIPKIRGLANVYFDTSAICEAEAFEAIFGAYGPTRLLYGSDFPVSETRGRAVSVGDGFHWIYDFQQEEWPFGKPVLAGIESLLALKRACDTFSLNESDINLIFSGNARSLLRLESAGSAPADEQALYREAKNLMPGGTQLLSKRPEMFAPDVWPPYFREARGCEVVTHDGRRVIDFTTGGIGSCLLGYAHPHVTDAVLRRVRLGAMSSLNPPEEVELARELLALHPWGEQVRFGRAGGEALAIAARIARAATGRDVIAFCGYHGWHDWYLSANLSQGNALGGHLLPGLEPTGVPRNLRGTAVPFASNDLDALREIVRANEGNLAAVIMEPARSVDPAPGFLEGVQALCRETGARLIFDEVTSGFRFSRGGLHLKYGIEPDIAVYAKALGNGHPIAAVVGRRETMQAAEGSFISSTYWTDSVGPAAALATLEVMSQIDVPAYIHNIGTLVQQGYRKLGEELGVPVKVGGFPALTSLAFDRSDNMALITYYTSRMIARGYLSGANFYPTAAHTPEHVGEFLEAVRLVFEDIAQAIEKGDISSRLQGPVKHGGFARLN